MKPRIEIESSSVRFLPFVSSLKRTLFKSAHSLRREDLELHVCLITDARMRVLNRQYRGSDKVTNVLSFPFLFLSRKSSDFVLPRSLPCFLGEIFLAPDYILKHSEDVHFLVIHGFLHLLGYTHVGKHDTIKMQRMEKRLLRAAAPHTKVRN